MKCPTCGRSLGSLKQRKRAPHECGTLVTVDELDDMLVEGSASDEAREVLNAAATLDDESYAEFQKAVAAGDKERLVEIARTGGRRATPTLLRLT